MTDVEQQLQLEIIQTTNARLLPETSLTLFKEKLVSYINDLIDHDFGKLIRILYTLDVSEQKLKEALASSSSTHAGVIIAEMIIERQLQRIKTRSQYHQKKDNISDEEKW
ncbi:MAG TPA: hypothetical protein VH396_04245 [Chitinophagaceae bacterium]|jgi:ribosome-associated translation inhibitor RaiA